MFGNPHRWNPAKWIWCRELPTSRLSRGLPGRIFRVVANSFLSDGGDNFSVFKEGQDKYVGGLDIDALTRYLGIHDPYSPTPTDRIDVVE